MAFLLAGGTLLSAITGQYLVFDTRFREIISSVEVQRTLSRNPVRKGTILNVTTRVTFRGSPRMKVQVSDLPPPNTLHADGVTTVATLPDANLQELRLSYRIIPTVHGTHRFSGLSVRVANLFFEETLVLSRDSDCKPDLSVLPTGLFAAPSSDTSDSSRDNRKASVWSGIDVHSLREYTPGDDLRHVDWKISAKYDKIFIRKYAGLMSHPPLVIVDLPWNGAPCPEKEFGHLISDVTGLVSHTIQNYQQVSVLLISGPNILHLIREEKNISRCMAELREWMHPAERPVHFYHMADRSDLRGQVRNIEHALEQTTDPQARTYYELLQDRCNRILLYQRNPVFSGQVARALSPILMHEAYIFSPGCGDTSHIRHIVRPLQTRQIRVHIRIIDTAEPEKAAVAPHPGTVQEARV